MDNKLLVAIGLLLFTLPLLISTYLNIDTRRTQSVYKNIDVTNFRYKVKRFDKPKVENENTNQTINSTIEDNSITIEKIFDGIDSDTNNDSTWTLLVGGDVMIGRTVNYKTLTYNDFDWPYKNITTLIDSADYTFVNLESPVIDNCPIKNDGLIFCGDNRHIPAMSRAGIDIVSLANNHTLNQGISGLENTINLLNKNNIVSVGVENPIYIDIEDQKIAFLGYNEIECYPGVACIDEQQIKADIEVAKANSDYVIIMYHWGGEYRDYPTDYQVEVAHYSIDYGADLVLGNHPHWIQPFEIYEDKLIMYSHGNTVFDQMWSAKTREGVFAKYIFNGANLIDVELYPTLIEDYGQPYLLEGNAKSEKLEFIEEISRVQNTQ